MPFIALAIGAGVGALKSEVVDRPKEQRQRKLAAETQRYSPWTGMNSQPVQEADPFGSALQYGVGGASMYSGVQGAKAQQGWLDRGGNPAMSASVAGSGKGFNPWTYDAATGPSYAQGAYGPMAQTQQQSPWGLNGRSSIGRIG